MASAPPTAHPLRPSVEVLVRGGLTVTAVDEQELQRRPPPGGDDRRLAHDGNDVVVQPRGIERAAEGRQRVEQTGDLVDQRGIVVLPAGLVLFGAVVVVDRVEHAGRLLGRRAEQQRGFAAVRADLDTDAAVEIAQRGVVKRAPLIGGQETPHLFGQRKQALGRTRIDVTHPLNLSFPSTAPARWSTSSPRDRARSSYAKPSGRGRTALPSCCARIACS